MALIITIAFILTRFKMFRKLLLQTLRRKEYMSLTGIFGLIGIFGTYSAVEIQGALANSRVIGVVVAGLLGGPLMGGGAGLIAGLHRFALGGVTGPACGLSTFVEGLLAGVIRNTFLEKKASWEAGLFTGIMAESLQMLLLLLLVKPFDMALKLVKAIGAPMIVWNSIGIAIFMIIVKNAQEEEDRIAAVQTQKALTIANTTLSYLRNGLTYETAQTVCQVIKKFVAVAAVSITDSKKILAHIGAGSDHHLPGEPIRTEATKWVLENSVGKIAETKEDICCSNPSCPLHSAVIVPLFCRGQVIGSLKLYHEKKHAVSTNDLEFAKGLSTLFSNQLDIATLEQQSKLLKQAELDALQAQVNPHFLFNAINTIISFSRIEPETSRRLLRQLGEFFRKSLLRGKKIITLAEELERIEAYLALEQARFGKRLLVDRNIDPLTLQYPLPALILQPLVENCIKHGILPKSEGGSVSIHVLREAEIVKIIIRDNGVGIPPEIISELLVPSSKKYCGIGLYNVNERLKTIYGKEHQLLIESTPGQGTVFTLNLPLQSPLVLQEM